MTDTLESNIAALLKRIAGCFRRDRVPYALIGAWALTAWGRTRATADVDFLVLLDAGNLSRLGDQLVRAGMTLDETWIKWNPLLRGSQMRFQFEGAAIDLLRPRDAHDHEVFKRRRKRRMDGRYYWLVSPRNFVTFFHFSSPKFLTILRGAMDEEKTEPG